MTDLNIMDFGDDEEIGMKLLEVIVILESLYKRRTSLAKHLGNLAAESEKENSMNNRNMTGERAFAEIFAKLSTCVVLIERNEGQKKQIEAIVKNKKSGE